MTKPVRVDNCPLCQPRYSRSPDRLGMRPIIPPSSSVTNNGGHPQIITSNNSKKHHHHQLQPKHSYGDLLASRNRPPTLQRMEKKSRGRRSHSEFRPPASATMAQTQVSAVNNGQPPFLTRHTSLKSKLAKNDFPEEKTIYSESSWPGNFKNDLEIGLANNATFKIFHQKIGN